MLGWMKHRLESRLPGEISITSEMQMSTMSTDENHEYHGSMLWLALTTRMNISIQSTPVKGRNPFTMHQITMYQIILYTPNILQFYLSIQFSSVQSLSCVWLTATPWQKVKKNQRGSWWKWKRRVKKLKLNIQKAKIVAFDPITSLQIDGETMETVADFFEGGLQNHCRWWLQPWN